MKIHEYQGKELFRKFGMTVPRGIPAFSVDEAVDAAQTLGGPIWLVKARVCMSQSSRVRPSPGRTSRMAIRLGSLVGISNVTSGFCEGGSRRTPPACQSRMATVRALGTSRLRASSSRDRRPSLSIRVRLAANAAHKPAILLRRSLRRLPADAAGWRAQLSIVMTKPVGRESRSAGAEADFKRDATLDSPRNWPNLTFRSGDRTGGDGGLGICYPSQVGIRKIGWKRIPLERVPTIW